MRGTIKIVNGADYLADQVAESQRVARRAMVYFWWKNYLPRHFQVGAEQKYSYQKRKKKYMIIKARRKKHQRPLVWTGETEKRARRQITVKDKVLKKKRLERTIGVMDVPAYFYKYKPGQPNKASEATRVTEGERDQLLLIGDAAAQDYLDSFPPRIQRIAI